MTTKGESWSGEGSWFAPKDVRKPGGMGVQPDTIMTIIQCQVSPVITVM